MPPVAKNTHNQARSKRVAERVRKQLYRARLPVDKKAKIHKRQAKIAQIGKKMIKDRLDNVKASARRIRRQAKRLSEENEVLQGVIEGLSKYERFQEEEPQVKDDEVAQLQAAYDFACHQPSLFKKLTGETLASFKALYEVAQAPLAARNYRGEVRQRAPHAPQRVSDTLQLFVTLVFLRQYPTYALLIFALRGLCELTLHHYIHRVLRALDAVADLRIKWPTDDEFKELLKRNKKLPYPWLRNVVCAVDGTEIRVARPTKGAIKNAHYSGKKKQYALNVLLIVRLDGFIIYSSKPQPKMNDQSVWLDENLRQRFIGKPYGIAADGGFTLNYTTKKNKRDLIIGATPNKRPRSSKKNPGKQHLTLVQKQQNRALSRIRVVVENTNRRLKQYKILGTKLRHYRPGATLQSDKGITPALVVSVVAGLTNLGIERSPIRSRDWVPKNVSDEDAPSVEGSDCDDE
jgi:hypothetical protein